MTTLFIQVSNADYACLETEMKSIVKEKQNFERLEVRKEVLMEMFKVYWIKLIFLMINTNFYYKCSTIPSSWEFWTKRWKLQPPPSTGVVLWLICAEALTCGTLEKLRLLRSPRYYKCKVLLEYSVLTLFLDRTLLLIGRARLTLNLCSASTAFHSQIISNWKSGRRFKRRLQSGITEKLAE